MKYAWVLFGFYFLSLGSLFSVEAKNYDYEDFSSDTLITKAFVALEAEDWDAVDAYTAKCILLYQAEARRMQKKLKIFLAADIAHSQWALNHVACSHFLRGQMFEKQKKVSKSSEEYDTCIRKYGFAQAWDPKTNSFWKVAVEARKNLDRLKWGSP
jgi:hypothetical protein